MAKRKGPVSQAQLRWAFATHKTFAKKWARRAKGRHLPEQTRARRR
jgi:hypothetical protein